MSDQPLYAGFDLGTTNSAAAAFDGDGVVLIRNDSGGTLTPSVVRIDARGRTIVGHRAARHLERDPDNTHSEFKRLMGTDRTLRFASSGESRRPEELAANVLRALRSDMKEQLGVEPLRAVISVPALFELPQSRATSEAARIAGFEYVELIQEPVASALAAGWRDTDPGSWLVYDLGGGTFDVSLLETRDGLLRVVGHDGDNFLGGRDFDGAIVGWLMAQLAERDGVVLNRDDPAHRAALLALKHVAEDAKIQLSRKTEVDLEPGAPVTVDGVELDVDFSLSRATLEEVCTPGIERSVQVCRRLLQANGLAPADVTRVVLVGGPTVMPFLRAQVSEGLGIKVAEGHDPMTLVASGAAMYAATAGVDARGTNAARKRSDPNARKMWLQYPPVSSDLTPHVLGRVTDASDGPRATSVRFVRGDGEWRSEPAIIDDQGAFVAMVELAPRRPNRFRLEMLVDDGTSAPVDPSEITIVQGMTIGDPPLSRSIGVALANNDVQTYFERGTALPARRTFTHTTIATVSKGTDQAVLRIPMVQGEFEQAHLCRLVGVLEVSGVDLRRTVPSGTTVEVTLDIDRGGCLSGAALIPSLDQTFDGIAQLVVPNAAPETLAASLSAVRERLHEESAQAFRRGDGAAVSQIQQLEDELSRVAGDVAAAHGGDHDAGHKAARAMQEIDGALVDIELTSRWPAFEAECEDTLVWAIGWIGEFGSETEQRLIDRVAEAMERARGTRNVRELTRQQSLARRLGETAYMRHPEAWKWRFEHVASLVHETTDLPAAQKLVDEGRAAIDRNDTGVLEALVRKLSRLFPPSAEARRMSFDSGVR